MARLLAALLAVIASAAAHAQSTDPRIADLVRAGKVRFGTFPPQYTKDAKGELKGPFVEMMRAAAAHMGLPIELIELPTPAKLVECLDSGACDYGSLGFDPARADKVEGFEAFTKKEELPEEKEKKEYVPVFGRRSRKYKKGV